MHVEFNLQQQYVDDYSMICRDFEVALGLVKWPCISAANESLTATSDNLLKLILAAQYLFLVCIWKNMLRFNIDYSSNLLIFGYSYCRFHNIFS